MFIRSIHIEHRKKYVFLRVPQLKRETRQLKLRATHGKTGLRRLEVQSAQADFTLCCPQIYLPGLISSNINPRFSPVARGKSLYRLALS